MTNQFYKLTYKQMADIVQELKDELKLRNPIGVNFYTKPFDNVIANLTEISNGEKHNRTSLRGPIEK